MPAGFTAAFAQRLNRYSPMHVTEAREGDSLSPGRALLARGDTHLTIRHCAGGWCAHYTNQRKVNFHCPSVDVLFASAAAEAGRLAVGVLLTGMGADGARELLHLRECGALTVAQDARSSAVYGMPKVAREIGAADLIAPPAEIPRLIVERLGRCSTQAVRT